MIGALSVGSKLVIWLLFVLVLPFLTIPLIRRVLREDSNAAIFLILSGYTALDTLAAWLLMGGGDLGIWPALLLIAGAAAAGLYNYVACAAIRKYGG